MRVVLYLDGKFYNTLGNWLLNFLVPVSLIFWMPVIGSKDAQMLNVCLAPFYAFIPSYLAASSIMEDVANGILAMFHQSSRSLISYVFLKMLVPLGLSVVGYFLGTVYLFCIGQLTVHILIGYVTLISTLVISLVCVLPLCLQTRRASMQHYQSLTAVIQGGVVMCMTIAEVFVSLGQTSIFLFLSIVIPLLMAVVAFLVSLQILHRRYVQPLGIIPVNTASNGKPER
ncbi:MAG: hypothetical protein LKI77_07470 [Bifidobacterium sp.]|jgi:hypothetical protein|nr:hypothetical protein [Bifidobacterium sp.]